MNKYIQKIALPLFYLLAAHGLFSCVPGSDAQSTSVTTYFIQSGSKMYPETIPDSLKLYSGDPEFEYIIIGNLSIAVAGELEIAYNRLRKEAAKLGAECVIRLEIYNNGSGMSGIAVKNK
ncbi:MAG: hypothetical protein KAH48_01820 [Chlorobi bacterium]|nr:hypothetical protein [Chlorobiota bacterium]